jgi:hypothetical protein
MEISLSINLTISVWQSSTLINRTENSNLNLNLNGENENIQISVFPEALGEKSFLDIVSCQ